jgi:hypothetical protein
MVVPAEGSSEDSLKSYPEDLMIDPDQFIDIHCSVIVVILVELLDYGIR